MPPRRSVGVDLVRVLGIVAVVAGHVWTTELSRLLVFPWHVPLFFFLTGWFWTSGRAVGSEVRGRWRTLLRPYATWFVLISLAWYPSTLAAGGASDVVDLLRPFLGGQYVGRPYSAFWFVTALAVAAVALRLLERFPPWAPWAVALAAVGVATVSPGVLRLPPASAGTALACLLFVLAGSVARRWLPRLPSPGALGAALLLVGAASTALGSAPLDLKQADFGTPVVSAATAVVLCSGLTLVGLALDDVVPHRLGAVVSRLAGCGIAVVLLHAAVIWVAEPFVQAPWVFVLSVTLPWTAALLLEHTRAAPWLLGVRTPASTGGRPTTAPNEPVLTR